MSFWKKLKSSDFKIASPSQKAEPTDYLATLRPQLLGLGLPLPDQREYRFCRPRLFRFDFAWTAVMIALEVEGGLYGHGPKCSECGRRKGGGHSSIRGIERDIEKYNLAVLFGWKVLRVTPEMLEAADGRAALLLEKVLRQARRENVEILELKDARETPKIIYYKHGQMIARNDPERLA